MGVKKPVDQEKAANELRAGLDKLRAGKKAADWVCLEVLGLLKNCNLGQVVNNCHQQLDTKLIFESEEMRQRHDALAIMAAACLLKKRL